MQDRLSIAVELVIGSDVFAIPGGNVSACALRLRLWGLEGEVSFLVHGELAEDAVLARFTSSDRADVRLTLSGALPLVESPPEPLVVRGVATERSLRELSVAAVSGAPVLTREYTVRFADAAQVLWRQHFPLALRAEATMADVLAEQTAGVPLDVGVAAAQVTHHVVCLPLGAEQGASFYDLLAGWLDAIGGHLLHDYGTGGVLLRDRKPGGTPVKVRGTEVAGVSMELPAVRRSVARVRNGAAEHPATVPVPSDAAVAGLVEDHLVVTSLSAAVDDRVELETTRLRLREPALRVRYASWPTVPFAPGQAITLAPEWLPAGGSTRGRSFRVTEVELRAASQDLEGRDKDGTDRVYDLELTSAWESAGDLHAHLPPHVETPASILAEGKVVCDAGQPGDRIYAIHQDPDTGEWFYEVLVPVWNQEVRAPFRPTFVRGHMYAPLTKDQRVLVELGLHHAAIVRTLAWSTGAQQPLETQGNRVVFGKNAASQTTLEHVYVDEKPVWTVRRVQGADGQLLQMEEGILLIEVGEDPNATSTEQTFDLSPDVAQASGTLEAAATSSVGRIGGAFAAAKGELDGKLEDAKGSVGGAVDALAADLGGQIGGAKAELKAAAAALAGSAEQLGAAAASAVAELRAHTTG